MDKKRWIGGIEDGLKGWSEGKKGGVEGRKAEWREIRCGEMKQERMEGNIIELRGKDME